MLKQDRTEIVNSQDLDALLLACQSLKLHWETGDLAGAVLRVLECAQEIGDAR